MATEKVATLTNESKSELDSTTTSEEKCQVGSIITDKNELSLNEVSDSQIKRSEDKPHHVIWMLGIVGMINLILIIILFSIVINNSSNSDDQQVVSSSTIDDQRITDLENIIFGIVDSRLYQLEQGLITMQTYMINSTSQQEFSQSIIELSKNQSTMNKEVLTLSNKSNHLIEELLTLKKNITGMWGNYIDKSGLVGIVGTLVNSTVTQIQTKKHHIISYHNESYYSFIATNESQGKIIERIELASLSITTNTLLSMYVCLTVRTMISDVYPIGIGLIVNDYVLDRSNAHHDGSSFLSVKCMGYMMLKPGTHKVYLHVNGPMTLIDYRLIKSYSLIENE